MKKKKIPTISDKEIQKINSDAKLFPPISEKKVEKSFITCPHCRQKIPLGAKFCVTCGQKVEVLKPIPPISDIEEETSKIPPAEELQPTPSVIEIKEEEPQISPAEEVQLIPSILEKKEEKRKLEPRVCKFCGMRIPKNRSFCLQCGMIIKSN